jgi:hypothetical protein
MLLWYGFLGIPDESDQPVYTYDRDYDMRRLEAERERLRPDTRYFVNPAFLRGLEPCRFGKAARNQQQDEGHFYRLAVRLRALSGSGMRRLPDLLRSRIYRNLFALNSRGPIPPPPE